MILVDTNILLDIATNDAAWADWSIANLDAAARLGPVIINAVIYSEFSVGYDQMNQVDRLLNEVGIDWSDIPREALFLAGKAFQTYRRQGGQRTRVLPDFFIGAHAFSSDMTLLTRDVASYSTYFPNLRLISPDKKGA